MQIRILKVSISLMRDKFAQKGFTLLEVLVSLIIVSLVVVVFLQLLTSSLKLHGQSEESLEEIVKAQSIFDSLMLQDVRKSEFQWEKESEQGSWKLEVEPVETVQKEEEEEEEEISFKLTTELYKYIFTYISPNGQRYQLCRYEQYGQNHFNQDFVREHINE